MSEVNNKHSKRDAKNDKILRKQQGFFISRRDAELEMRNLQTEDKFETLNVDPLYKKAMKWWTRLDEKYFKTVTKEQASLQRENTTSDKILTNTSIEPTALLTYRQQMISTLLPSAKDRNYLKVLFKNQSLYNSLLAVYDLEACLPNNKNPEEKQLEKDGFRINCLNKCQMVDENVENSLFSSEMTAELRSYRMDMIDMTDNYNFCSRAQKLQEIVKNRTYIHEIDQQIYLWEWELKNVNNENTINWNYLISNIMQVPEEQQINPIDLYDDQIKIIKERLLWNTILRYFQNGFQDKTKHMLDNYIMSQQNMNLRPQKGHSVNRFIETDCKICFCSYNNDSNQVIYCDSCNTSYHLACYGLSSLPEDEEYFCDRCQYTKKQQSRSQAKIKRLNCQICGRVNFPMKKIQDHFYHVTCLVLFNLVQFQQEKLQLRGSLAHHNIIQMVIENELKHDECDYCRKSSGSSLGMQLICAYEGCDNSLHPICAYIAGCRMNVKKNSHKKLSVEVFCNRHGNSRMQQAYLRRYMCNLKETSSKSLRQFSKQYEQEDCLAQSLKDNNLKMRKKYINRILIFTKFLRNYFLTKEKKQSNDIQTESKKLLLSIVKSKN